MPYIDSLDYTLLMCIVHPWAESFECTYLHNHSGTQRYAMHAAHYVQLDYIANSVVYQTSQRSSPRHQLSGDEESLAPAAAAAPSWAGEAARRAAVCAAAARPPAVTGLHAAAFSAAIPNAFLATPANAVATPVMSASAWQQVRQLHCTGWQQTL